MYVTRNSRYPVRLNGALLLNGDCMTQEQFHSLYLRESEGFRGELINGVVFVSEPLGNEHATNHGTLVSVFSAYKGNTPGTSAGINGTVILGPKDEVQPDLCLRISAEYGGQSRLTPGRPQYIEGPPELIIEVAFTTMSMDLRLKRNRYQRAGVLEYVVFCLDPIKIEWLDLANRSKIRADEHGVFRSKVFPGLWVDSESVVSQNYKKAMETIEAGLESDEHARFVKKLACSYR